MNVWLYWLDIFKYFYWLLHHIYIWGFYWWVSLTSHTVCKKIIHFLTLECVTHWKKKLHTRKTSPFNSAITFHLDLKLACWYRIIRDTYYNRNPNNIDTELQLFSTLVSYQWLEGTCAIQAWTKRPCLWYLWQEKAFHEMPFIPDCDTRCCLSVIGFTHCWNNVCGVDPAKRNIFVMDDDIFIIVSCQ